MNPFSSDTVLYPTETVIARNRNFFLFKYSPKQGGKHYIRCERNIQRTTEERCNRKQKPYRREYSETGSDAFRFFEKVRKHCPESQDICAGKREKERGDPNAEISESVQNKRGNCRRGKQNRANYTEFTCFFFRPTFTVRHSSAFRRVFRKSLYTVEKYRQYAEKEH